jgi:serine/threonine-protein kinase RsbW
MEEGALLQLTAGLKDLVDIRSYLRKRAKALHLDSSTTYDLLLIVTEIVTNSLVYGYKGMPGLIEVEMIRDGDALVVRLRDQAEAFDPTQVLPPDLSLPLEKRPLGGMGIYLTRQLVDQFSYQRLQQGYNEITLVINQISKRTNREGNHENGN